MSWSEFLLLLALSQVTLACAWTILALRLTRKRYPRSAVAASAVVPFIFTALLAHFWIDLVPLKEALVGAVILAFATYYSLWMIPLSFVAGLSTWFLMSRQDILDRW